MNKKFNFFISYDQPSAQWAQSFAESLKVGGYSVWFDRESSLPSEGWPKASEEALRASGSMIVIIDGRSAIRTRSRLYFEVGAALMLGKKIIVITPKGFDQSKLPDFLQNRTALARKAPGVTAYELLAKTAG